MLKQFFIAAALGLSGLAAVSGFEPATVYTPENFSKEYRDAMRKEIPAFLQKTEKSLKALNADFAKTPASEIQKERFTKRMEIAEKLLALMKKDAGSENPDAPLFLERERNDMNSFLAYFKQEIRLAKRVAAMKETVFDLSQFGAKGDGVANNYAAFEKIKQEIAKTRGKVLVKIPKGIYYIHPGKDAPHIQINEMKNVTFDGGNEAVLLFGNSGNHCSGIQIFDSENVTFRGLTLEYKGKLYAQGTIVSVDPATSSVVLKMEPDSPLPYLKQVTMAFDSNGKMVKAASDKFFHKVEKLADGTCKAQIGHALNGKMEGLKPGVVLVIPNRLSGAAFGISGGKFCSAENITVLNSIGLAFASSNSMSPSFVNCTVKPRKGEFLSSNADALFNWRPVEIGIFAKNCNFRNMSDDCFNTLAPGVALAEIRDGKLLPDNTNRDAGTNLLLVSPYTGEIKMQTTVVRNGTAKFKDGVTGELTLKHPIPNNIVTYANQNQAVATERERQEHFIGTKKLRNEPDMFFEPNHCGLGTVLVNYTAGNNRNNGITIHASNVLIENCKLENTGCGINITAMLNWKEGPAPYNVTVRNAKFTDCVFGIQSVYLSTLGKTLDMRSIREITVENADFSRMVMAGLRINNVDGGVFKNLVFKDMNRAVMIDNSGNLNFSDCKFGDSELTLSDLKLERASEDSIEGIY